MASRPGASDFGVVRPVPLREERVKVGGERGVEKDAHLPMMSSLIAQVFHRAILTKANTGLPAHSEFPKWQSVQLLSVQQDDPPGF